MNSDELLDLAKQIYALKSVISPSWDHQEQARESLNTAMQFFLAVQAEQAGDSTAAAGTAHPDSPQASLSSTAQPETGSSTPAAQPGSTTGSTGSSPDPDSTAEETAEAAPAAAPDAGRGSRTEQSQEQHTTSAIQEQAYAPVKR